MFATPFLVGSYVIARRSLVGSKTKVGEKTGQKEYSELLTGLRQKCKY